MTPGSTLMVNDTALNRSSAFWCMYRGQLATLVHVGADGLWDVVLWDGNPVEGANGDRFTVMKSAPAPRRWWQFWRKS